MQILSRAPKLEYFRMGSSRVGAEGGIALATSMTAGTVAWSVSLTRYVAQALQPLHFSAGERYGYDINVPSEKADLAIELWSVTLAPGGGGGGFTCFIIINKRVVTIGSQRGTYRRNQLSSGLHALTSQNWLITCASRQ